MADSTNVLTVHPPTSHPPQPPSDSQSPQNGSNPPSLTSSRALPRCAVVNFCRDGESLRWAPRVTHNTSGVPARIHNFEDAFSLEEYSSANLPVVWRARAGNPRGSASLDDGDSQFTRATAAAAAAAKACIPLGGYWDIQKKNADAIAASASVTAAAVVATAVAASSAANAPPPALPSNSDTVKAPHAPFADRELSSSSRAADVEHAQVTPAAPASHAPGRSTARSPSVKRTIVLANELRRPSFWSVLAHTSKYQKAKARARLRGDSPRRRSKSPARKRALGDEEDLEDADDIRSDDDSTSSHRRGGKTSSHRNAWAGLAAGARRVGGASRRFKQRGMGSRAATEFDDLPDTGAIGEENASGGLVRHQGSIFRRLVEHLERMHARREPPDFDESEEVNGKANRIGDGADTDQGDEEDATPVRTRSRWMQALGGGNAGRNNEQDRTTLISSRRSKGGVAAAKGRTIVVAGHDSKDLTVIPSQDDQYMSFITSVV